MKKMRRIIKNQSVRDLKKDLKKGYVLSDKCPSRDILKHISSRWGTLVMISLSDGEIKRFSELRRHIQGISEKMLGQTLKLLEADGLVLRHSYDIVPPVVEYSLTDLGKELAEKVIDLSDWIENNLFYILDYKESQKSL